jgi:hypothetical protein
MAVFVDKTFSDNPNPRPSHDIIVEEKNADWICKNAKFIYGQYVSGQTGITPEDVEYIQLLRRYAEGRQPTDQYKKRWLNDIKDQKTKNYSHVDWDNLYSPMPKYIDKMLGLFLSQDHHCLATCTNEYAKEYILDEKVKKYVQLKTRTLRLMLNELAGTNPEEDPMLNPMHSYAVRDLDEVEMTTSTGSVKLPYEIAAEKGVEAVQQISNYKHLKREAVRELASGFIAFREVIDYNKLRWENVDITDVIIEYSRNHHFSNSRYCGIQEIWTIGELLKKGFKEEELKKFAEKFHVYNMETRGLQDENRAFNFYNKFYSSSGTWGYDDYIVPVLYVAFKSDDVEYRKEVKTINGESRLYRQDFGKITPKTVVDAETKIYEGRWIMGTNTVFDNGIMAYMARDKATGVRLPIHISKLKGRSLIERARQILDEFAMLGYKMQHALAKATGKRYTIDFSALEDITKNSGGKLEPMDLVDMFNQGNNIPVRHRPLDDTVNFSTPMPVNEILGGIGIFLDEMLRLKDSLTKDLADVTGISPFEIPEKGTAVGVARLAVANMSDVLKPLYDIYLESKERLTYNTVYRLQLLLHYDGKKVNGHTIRNGSVDYYRNILGDVYVNILKNMEKNEPMDLGVSFEALPTEEQKQFIKEWAAQATAPGKNGEPILKGSEFLYLVDRVDYPSGIKEARMILEHRERQDEIKARQRQMEAIEAQGQAIEQQIAAKGQMDANTAQAKTAGKLEEIQLDRDLEARNKGQLQENEIGANMLNKGLEIGASNKEALEGQQQTV